MATSRSTPPSPSPRPARFPGDGKHIGRIEPDSGSILEECETHRPNRAGFWLDSRQVCATPVESSRILARFSAGVPHPGRIEPIRRAKRPRVPAPPAPQSCHAGSADPVWAALRSILVLEVVSRVAQVQQTRSGQPFAQFSISILFFPVVGPVDGLGGSEPQSRVAQVLQFRSGRSFAESSFLTLFFPVVGPVDSVGGSEPQAESRPWAVGRRWAGAAAKRQAVQRLSISPSLSTGLLGRPTICGPAGTPRYPGRSPAAIAATLRHLHGVNGADPPHS